MMAKSHLVSIPIQTPRILVVGHHHLAQGSRRRHYLGRCVPWPESRGNCATFVAWLLDAGQVTYGSRHMRASQRAGQGGSKVIQSPTHAVSNSSGLDRQQFPSILLERWCDSCDWNRSASARWNATSRTCSLIGTGSSSRANQLPCSWCARALVIRTALAGLLLEDGGPLPGRLHGEDEPVHGSTLMPQLSLAL